MSAHVECICPGCLGFGSWEEDCSSLRYGHRTTERRCDRCEGTGVEVREVEEGDEAAFSFEDATSEGEAQLAAIFAARGLTAWDTPRFYGDPPAVAWLPEGPSGVEAEENTAHAAA